MMTTTEEAFPAMVISIGIDIDLTTMILSLLSQQWSYGGDPTMRMRKQQVFHNINKTCKGRWNGLPQVSKSQKRCSLAIH